MRSVTIQQLSFEFVNSDADSALKESRSGTFVDNLGLRVHRWFRFSAGFSAEWARQLIEDRRSHSDIRVLDPFAGCGTTLIAAEEAGVESVGFENHPFMHKVASGKLLWHTPVEAFRRASDDVRQRAQRRLPGIDTTKDVPPLLTKCFTEESLCHLFALRQAFSEVNASDEAKTLIWLALTSILRSVSHVGTAQWQYVLPNKKKSNYLDAFVAFEQQCDKMASDMSIFQRTIRASRGRILKHNARVPLAQNGQFDLLLTSPPYPNNL